MYFFTIGNSWNRLLEKDLKRYIHYESFSSTGISAFSFDDTCIETSGAKMAWVESSNLENYPALSEIMQALHSLSYEINGM